MSEVVCGSCGNSFDQAEKLPLLMSCGHTFCKACLLQLYVNDSILICPNCGAEDSCSPETLPQNLILSEGLRKDRPAGADPWACPFHPSKNRAYVCEKTGELYCSECLDNIEDPSIAPIAAVYQRLDGFYDMYRACSAEELMRRTELYTKLSNVLGIHQVKINCRLDADYLMASEAFKNQITSVIALYQALGGGWVVEPDHETEMN